MNVRTPIIPSRVQICEVDGPHELNLEAICVFAATGFFLGGDCYYRNQHALQPATEYELDEGGKCISSRPYWEWHYAPRDITLDQAVDEFGELLERLTLDATREDRVVLPLSGGLDSRTLAGALRTHRAVHTYSYGFVDSFDETQYGRRIAEALDWPFENLSIPRGYLWRVLDDLARINGCYADFTHPRQMAVIDEIARLGDVFLLGHWGDVLFDNAALTSNNDLVRTCVSKIVKRGGIALASQLWTAWGLPGNFESYLRDRVAALLDRIRIDDPNGRFRAFKSMYWAPRWTTANLSVFENKHPIRLPYYDDEMCKLVCTLPESLLAGRRIQIEYLKRRVPRLARIAWQSYAPLNLYNYDRYYARRRLPLRALQLAKRRVRERIRGAPTVTRNWELQFVGPSNDAELRARLFDETAFRELVPTPVVRDIYTKFTNQDRVEHAHPLSMLLTLSMFSRSHVPQTSSVASP